MPTATGTVADHRLPLRPSELARFTAALAAEIGCERRGLAGGLRHR